MSASPDPAHAPSIASQPPGAPAAAAPHQPARAGLLQRLGPLKGVVMALAGLGALLSGLLGYWPGHQAGPVAPAEPRGSTAPASAGPLSVVVLPLANQTGDPQLAYIADVLTASMAEDLARVRDAYVVPAIKSLAYRPKAATVMQAGQDFGVRFVLQGSVQRGGDRMRVNLQLADAQSGALLWSDTAEGALGNLFALQDEVTARFGNSAAHEMILAAARASAADKGKATVPDLMLQARALALKPQSLAINQQMAELYRQVLALEPGNARAMAGLASSIGARLGNFGSATPAPERRKLYQEGLELVRQARQLGGQAPEVYAAVTMYTPTEDVAAYRAAAQAWLAQDPRNPSAHGALALSFLLAGEPDPAIELLNQAIRLDRRHASAFSLLNMGRAHFMRGDNEAAIGWYLQALQANPSYAHAHAYLAMAYALAGQDDKARSAIEDLRLVDPGYRFFANHTLPASSPAAFREYWDRKLLPAARKAALAQ